MPERRPIKDDTVIATAGRDPERNFGVTGRTAWIYYTQLNYQDCHMTLDRDLMRIPVEITMTP